MKHDKIQNDSWAVCGGNSRIFCGQCVLTQVLALIVNGSTWIPPLSGVMDLGLPHIGRDPGRAEGYFSSAGPCTSCPIVRRQMLAKPIWDMALSMAPRYSSQLAIQPWFEC